MADQSPDDGLGYWHGKMDARLNAVDQSIKRLDTSLETMKKEIVESNIRMAKYIGGVAVLLGVVMMLAPLVTKLLFTDLP